MKKKIITVVGGCGHIGLPLSIILCNKGYDVIAYDINKKIFNDIKKGQMPFLENNGHQELKKAIKSKRLTLTEKPILKMRKGDFIITIGTPVDEFLGLTTNLLKNVLRIYLIMYHTSLIMLSRFTWYNRMVKTILTNQKRESTCSFVEMQGKT